MTQDLQAVITSEGLVKLEWTAGGEAIDTGRDLLQQEIFRRYSVSHDSAFLYLGFCSQSASLYPSLDFFRAFCGSFGKKISLTPDIETVRQKVRIELAEGELAQTLESAPPMTGGEYLRPDTLKGLWERMHDEFFRELGKHKGTVEQFIRGFSPELHLVGRVYFHLVESRKDDYPFAFLATYSTGLSRQGKSQHLPLKNALSEYGGDNRKLLELLTTVHRAAKESALVAGLIESGELFHPLAWSAREAYTFLREIPLYEQSGILCRIPDWWKAGSQNPRVQVTIGGSQPSAVGMDALLSFDIGLSLGGAELTADEARRLLATTEGLALIKNRWVAVDPEKLRQTLEAYEKARTMIRQGGMTFRDALRFQMNPKALPGLTGDSESITVSNGQWLETVMARMRDPGKLDKVAQSSSFKAELRPYQQKGVRWLSFLHSLRFGMCLADDMGLGKTVQVLGLLDTLKQQSPKGANLLVVPASLLANWADELGRFAPHLTYHIAHPSGNEAGTVTPKNAGDLDGLDLVITTYSLIQKYEWLQSYAWKLIILDEAQAIKNPGTKQTRAVKKLTAANRIAMTGTPVENRLSDIWSIFDFLNPGLLGSAEEFGKFVKGLANDHEGYGRLRRVISPYILRRLKTDKTVIADLPDKIELKEWPRLGKKQAALYQKQVDDLKRVVETVDGIQRKGVILSALLKFKQICNHPDQFLGSGEFDESESGKFDLLGELCGTISEKRERVLVFTQFREMTGPLSTFLAGIFGRDGLVLHGGVPVGKRKGLVAAFQGEEYVPFMVLSLKAGGVGLNLTAANHVIHFDRWWNPSVENQATDRAFRIGQKKNVLVHKFITRGTVEEKIDQMIEGKLKLSADVVQAGSEAWITELGNKELMEIFSLTI